MEMKTHYIDGAMYIGCSEEYFTTYNPANGEPLANVKQANQSDMEAAIESAKRGFEVWSAMTAIERSRILNKAVAILRERNDELAALEVADTGKPIQEAIAVDITTGADVIEYYAGLAPSLQGEQQPLNENQFFYTAVNLWEFAQVLAPGTILFKSQCGNQHQHWLRVMQ